MKNNIKQAKLFVVVGPSGVGKGSILQEAIKKFDNLCYSISATTRPKRAGEQEGVNYFFKTKQEFKLMIENNQLLEWAEFVDNFYGTPSEYIQENIKKNKNLILEIEIQGARQIKNKMPDQSVLIFIAPPDIKSLENRLKTRSTETQDIMLKRLERAKQEIQEIEESKLFEHKIINRENELELAVDELKNIIIKETCFFK